MSIKLAITDDHLLVISGIKAMLAPYPHISVVYESNRAGALMAALPAIQPDVLLLDIQMPEIDGIELCRQVKKKHPSVKVIAISSFMETHYIRQMLRNGAAGYLLKGTDPETLIHAIEQVHAGEQFLDELIRRQLVNEVITGQKRSSYEIPLTRREKEILKLIADEYSNQEIADLLFISLRTVETHRLNLTQKLAVKNTAGLVKEAMKRGIVE
ncbi:two component transcriptional regulator, LuxR family [Chitinophaga ginsengisegetis]|uniref:Two component transcriptional regulator, LuxR family n=1 Tax=Chitinophaga ginsengisegetis TaxID=393003 RepID=A0A1T5NPH6_9BACT|nr:response regulator transcription factor [Chitinophaga ginsengisegetis]MDR6565576.1 DNA-binding NarL/FixJ family response regulator [Chitinophaga ginsengisegetis]MDR6645305.1 DNA-binding NarL/FixJ family response regulator [Chitinophaga ginsengisegetis]MDR6652104.1 DNA-binding NarL/FixJ family response regulator [Chitinophaga ginsengisegetis]SKD02058.1 two component transcriptional regulator, LuxR family [Chitinophaga ginsengisegetis]